MNVPIEISFRDVDKTPALDNLIREQANRLENFCDHINSVRISVEQPNTHQKDGRPHRVRIVVRVPPGHELVAVRDSNEGDLHEPLSKILRDTFFAMERQLKDLVHRQHGDVKKHPAQEAMGFVAKLFKTEGYGFLTGPEGHEIYFHKNSVLNGGFDRLEIGTGVRFVEEAGDMGAQASTVDIVDKPGSRIKR